MTVKFEPEPTELEREAILAVLAETAGEAPSVWAESALADGVEEVTPDP